MIGQEGTAPRDLTAIVADIAELAPTLHKAGTFSARTLDALARHASESPVQHSVETGSGASTLLFSHLSAHHTVFAVDAGTGSIRSVEASPLLRRDVVTFVEGPTQLTLPRHVFQHQLQLALIDGPHGYPFPDLEYYYLYPHLEERALLVLDDIHIPTITHLFDFVRADEMFALQEVVETTAFFRRTSAPVFSPIGDGWWMQGYNKRAFGSDTAELVAAANLTRVDTPAPFYLDRFGPLSDPLRLPEIVVPHSEELSVAGWALDTELREPAAAVDFVLDGATYRAPVRVARPDVATAHGDDAYVRSGFNTRLPSRALSPGDHDLEIRIVLAGHRAYYRAHRVRFKAS